MKKKLLPAFMLSMALLPFTSMADVKSDMANAELSLVTVMQNAQADQLSTAEAVTQMIAADASQTSAIVATAMVVAPEDYAAIIKAAIDAGADPATVVASALTATGGENSAGIEAAALAAAPDERSEIQGAVSRISSAQPVTPTVANASGGGAGVTAEEVVTLQSQITQIESDLAAAGFSPNEVSTAISELTTALSQSQTSVTAATNSLESLKQDIADAQAAQEQLAAAQAAAEAAAAERASAEEESNVAISAASAAAAAAELAALELELAEIALAEAEAAVADLESVEATPEAIGAKRAEVEAELATLGDADEANASLGTAKADLEAAIQQDAALSQEETALQTAIAALESSAQGASAATGLTVTNPDGTRKSLTQLRTELQTLQTNRTNLNIGGKRLSVAELNRVVQKITQLEANRAVLTEAESNPVLIVNFLIERVGDRDRIRDVATELGASFNVIQSDLQQRQQAAEDELIALLAAIENEDDATETVVALEDDANLDNILDEIDDTIGSLSEA